MNREAGHALPWEKVYVFVSSTFADMHAERDYLVKKVFPELADWCEQRRLRLVDIDLRWGVTEEDLSGKQAVGVCLRRINECRPFFLCFLGQRHGWVPGRAGVSPETLDEFPDLREALHSTASITELEIQHAILRPFLSRTTGAPPNPPPAAEHAFFYFREPCYQTGLAEAPIQLRALYSDEVALPNESEPERRAREGALDALRRLREAVVVAALRHPPVRYRATWNSALRTPELALPFESPHGTEGTHRWRTTWNRFASIGLGDSDLAIPGSRRATAEGYNAALTRGRLTEFQGLGPAGRTESIGAELATIIREDLTRAILLRHPDRAMVPAQAELERELDQQAKFLFVSAEGFIEREGDFDALDSYLAEGPGRTMVLTGPSGTGKSTLLARWIERFRAQQRSAPGGSLHFRFIGQSDRSGTVHHLLHSVLSELRESGKIPPTHQQTRRSPAGGEETVEVPLVIPDDPSELRRAFPDFLEIASRAGSTVVVLDSLNQLQSAPADLAWVPRRLPANLKLIVSLKLGDEAGDELLRQLRERSEVLITEIAPFADLEDRRRLVRAYLGQYLKELDQRFIEELIRSGSPAGGAANPLFLKIVLSELRIAGSPSDVAERIRRDFGETPESAFDAVLRRLETDPAHSPLEPTRAVPALFGLIAHARNGLSAEEIAAVLVPALGLPSTFETREAAADVAHLVLRQVRGFLARREGRYDFFYESFRAAARRRYVMEHGGTSDDALPRREWHRRLANYFWDLPTREPDAATGPAIRKLSELPYQLVHAGEWDRLTCALSDLRFIEAKCAASLTGDLLDDYRLAMDALPEGELADRVRTFGACVLAESHGLVKHSGHPGFSAQQVYNRLGGGPQAEPLDQLIRSAELGAHALLEVPQFREAPNPYPAVIRTLGGPQHGSIKSIAITRDGRRAVSSGLGVGVRAWDLEHGECLEILNADSDQGGIALTADGRTMFSAEGGRLWRRDLATGAKQEIANTDREIEALAVTPNGSRVVMSHALDPNIVVWDAGTGTLRTVVTDLLNISSLALSADGRVVLLGGEDVLRFDYRLRLWDMDTGRCLGRLRGHHASVMAVTMTADGRLAASGSTDRMVRYWDLKRGRCLRVLKGHQDRITGVALTADGNLVLSGSLDGTLKVWSTKSGRPLKSLTWQTAGTYSLAVTPDGRRAVSGGLDGTILVWDIERGRTPPRRLSHLASVSSVAAEPDTRLAVSGSEDGTVKFWDLGDGQCVRTQVERSSVISALSITPDGRRVLSVRPDQVALINKQFIRAAGRVKGWDPVTGRGSERAAGRWRRVLGIMRDAMERRAARLYGFYGRPRLPKRPLVQSPDGRLAAVLERGVLALWDGDTVRRLRELPVPGEWAEALALSPDGRIVAVVSDSHLTLMSLDGRTLDEPSSEEEIHAVGFTPDGRTLVIPGTHQLILADLGGGPQRRFPHGGDPIKSLVVSDDARLAIAGAGNYLQVWELERANCVALAGGPFALNPGALAIAGRLVIAGDDGAQVIFRELKDLARRPPFSTAVRLWRYAPTPAWRFSSGRSARGRWDERLSAACGWCGRRFPVPPLVLTTIGGIEHDTGLHPDAIPCRDLPREAWDEPKLRSECPECRGPLRFNPFVVDNRGEWS